MSNILLKSLPSGSLVDIDWHMGKSIEVQGAEPSFSKKASAWGTWAASHPKGQLFSLLVFTLPLGIWGLVNSQNSFDALSDAISDFDKILDNWKMAPFTKVKIIDRTEHCSRYSEGGIYAMAYSDYGKQRWPGANTGPCACAKHQYQVNPEFVFAHHYMYCQTSLCPITFALILPGLSSTALQHGH